METKTCVGLLLIIIIIIIVIVLVYKNFSVIEENILNIEFFISPTTTTIPITTFNIANNVKNKLESRYNEILQSQYENIKKQKELDDLTDRLNVLNSELQKHTNSYMKYQTTGELNFY